MRPHTPASADKPQTTEQAALLPRPGSLGDAFLGLLALVAVLGAGFSFTGGPGRGVEFLAAAGIIVLSYAASWRGGRIVAVCGVFVFLFLEAHYGRLDSAHYWQIALFAAAFASSALAAAYVRLTADERRVGLLDAQTAIDAFGRRSGVGVRGLSPLAYELERARRHNHQVSLLVLRPDDLDEVAARYGDEGVRAVHAVVDRVLLRQLRAIDVALHDGLHDHWVILPQTPPLDARAAGERLRLALNIPAESVDVVPGERVDITISIGIASFPDDGSTNDEVAHAARLAFQRAVELGGNRSMLHSASGNAPAGWVVSGDRAP